VATNGGVERQFRNARVWHIRSRAEERRRTPQRLRVMPIDPAEIEPSHVVTILTTEHFVLQTARSATLADAQSRSTILLTSVSSSLVALAFVGQATKMGPAFFVFAYVIFTTLYAMGVLTFVRVVQTAVEDTIHARGIARVRHAYLEMAPQLEPYFIHGTSDDMRGMIADMGVAPSRYQTFLTSSATIAFIASVLLGVVIGVSANDAFGVPVVVAVCAGVAGAFVNFFVLQNVSNRMWSQSERRFPPRFPSNVPHEREMAATNAG